MIAAYGFGLDVNTQANHNHPFAVNATAVMSADNFSSPLALVFGVLRIPTRFFYSVACNLLYSRLVFVPDVLPGLSKYANLFPNEAGRFFAKAAHDICIARSKDPVTRQDFLGLLVKAIKEVTNQKSSTRRKLIHALYLGGHER